MCLQRLVIHIIQLKSNECESPSWDRTGEIRSRQEMRKQIRVDWYRTGLLEQHNSITAPCNIELNKTKAAKMETTEKDRDQAKAREVQ